MSIKEKMEVSKERDRAKFVEDLYEWAFPNDAISIVSQHPCFMYGKHFFKVQRSDDHAWLVFVCCRCGKLHSMEKKWWF